MNVEGLAVKQAKEAKVVKQAEDKKGIDKNWAKMNNNEKKWVASIILSLN